MSVKQFSLDTLATLDGGAIKEAFEKEIKTASEDCEDRPYLKRARTVAISVILTPNLRKDGNCDGFSIDVDMGRAKLPKMQASTTPAKRGPGGIFINDFNPDDVEGQRKMFPGPGEVGAENVDAETGEIQGEGTNG